MNHKAVLLWAIFAIAIVIGVHAQSGKRKGPIVRQVDRILIDSSHPNELFELFSKELQLPEAWPLTTNQGYVTGGVSAGNVNLEFYRYAQPKGAPARKTKTARYSALALEPYPIADALRELKVSGIPYGAPEPFTSTLPNGKQGVQWTTVPLPSYSRPGLSIFLYEYSPAFLKVEVRRKQLGNRLTLNNGGPLGILSVREIVIAAENFERDKAAWQSLLGSPNSAGSWSVGAGPAIRLVKGTEDRIQAITFAVKSLAIAKEFLKINNLRGSSSNREIFLNSLPIQGLKIRLTH